MCIDMFLFRSFDSSRHTAAPPAEPIVDNEPPTPPQIRERSASPSCTRPTDQVNSDLVSTIRTVGKGNEPLEIRVDSGAKPARSLRCCIGVRPRLAWVDLDKIIARAQI